MFETDRNLTAFGQASQLMQDCLCLYIMGRDNEIRGKICAQFPRVRYIPFITPPDHLAVTAKADIGILPYYPEKIGHYSGLNALLFAPNKIFEHEF